MKKLPLVLVLAFAATFIVACGDNKDPRISDRGAVCLKVLEMGGSCGPTTGGTTTATATSTVTVTQTN